MWEHRLTAPSSRVTRLQGEGLSALLLCSMAFDLLELRLTPVLPDWKLNYQCSQGWTGPGKLVLINQTQKTLIPSLVGCFRHNGYLASNLYCLKSSKWDQIHPQNTAWASTVDHAKSLFSDPLPTSGGHPENYDRCSQQVRYPSPWQVLRSTLLTLQLSRVDRFQG